MRDLSNALNLQRGLCTGMTYWGEAGYFEDRDGWYESQRLKECDMENKETRKWGEGYPKWKKKASKII